MSVKIKILKENFYGHPYSTGHGQGPRFIHGDDDYRMGDYPTPDESAAADSVHEDSIPTPRARVSAMEDYTKAYAYLMGHGNMATGLTLEEIMEKTEAADPLSVAQGLADYLNDRARTK